MNPAVACNRWAFSSGFCIGRLAARSRGPSRLHPQSPLAVPGVSSLQRGFPLADRRRVDVILLEDHPKLGYKHSVVPVRPGYARNWLTTEGLAVYATEENRAKFNLPLKRQKQNIVVDKDAEELTRMRNYLELLTKNIGRLKVIFKCPTKAEQDVINRLVVRHSIYGWLPEQLVLSASVMASKGEVGGVEAASEAGAEGQATGGSRRARENVEDVAEAEVLLKEGDYRAWLRLQGGQLASVGAGFDYNDERIANLVKPVPFVVSVEFTESEEKDGARDEACNPEAA